MCERERAATAVAVCETSMTSADTVGCRCNAMMPRDALFQNDLDFFHNKYNAMNLRSAAAAFTPGLPPNSGCAWCMTVRSDDAVRCDAMPDAYRM